jgi:formamidopyrimidine-DNA glycosylase
MPELPEVETMRRGVAVIVGSQIEDVRLARSTKRPILIAPDIRKFRRLAIGQTVTAVERVGKRVVVCLTGERRIVIEPRMTGLALLADPPTQEHLRVRIRLSGGSAAELLYWDRRGLGSVRLFAPDQFARHFGPDRIGPDALALTPELLRARLSASRRAIKVALLDQRAVAGIGNLYASEILHLAKIHPEASCDSLRPAPWKRLHAAIVAVLEDAILHEGSTLSDGTYRNVLNQSGGYQNHHRVYDREGEICLTCRREKVVRLVQAQRSTFYCPRCQKKTCSPSPRARGIR